MRKNILLILLAGLLLTALPATARFNAAKSDAPKAYFGLRAGVGGSVYTNIDDPVAIGTPIGGIAIGFKVAKIPLYLETGALYMNMGSKVKVWEWDWDELHYRHWDRDSHHSGSTARYRKDYDSYTINNHSLMVPLVATYHLYASDNIIIQPFTGFYASYGFDGKQMDFGLREGVGFSFGHLYVNLGVNIGVIGQDRDEKDYWLEDGQHGSLFLGVGVNF